MAAQNDLLQSYAEAGFHFVRIARQHGKPSKGPTAHGWNLPRTPDNPNGYVADTASAAAWLKAGDNLGLALVPSGVVSLDIDKLDETRRVLTGLGLPFAEWLADPNRVEIQSGKANKGKLLFRVPDEPAPSSKKLVFGQGKAARSIFELRHGSAEGKTLQDVLPPSIHPDTGEPYKLVGDVRQMPFIPPELLALWREWPETLKSFDPEYQPPAEPIRKTHKPKQGERDAVAEFNAAHDLEDLLLKHGYRRKGTRYLRPGSESGIPGVTIFERDGRKLCYSHGGDALNDGHAHDAFDVYRLLECGGDWKQALVWNPEITAHNRNLWASAQVSAKGEFNASSGDRNPENDILSDPASTNREAMLYGLVGDIGQAAALDTEVNPVASAAGFLSFLGANVGRDVYFPVGNTRHHPRLYTLHVGRSGRGRKGDGLSLIGRIRKAFANQGKDSSPSLLGHVHEGGLSSREGLVCLIHDGYKQGKEEIPPIEDKRLWVVESEFANVLHQAKRDGNTLSAALRDAWDGISLKPATKNNRVWASDPHIGLACSITPFELISLIENRELSNGFANRFLIFWAERERLVPFPKPTPEPIVHELAERTKTVIEFARGKYPECKDSRPMAMTEEAKQTWKRLYLGELNAPEDSELLTAILERRAPMLLRLAMLFALTDLSLSIDACHINAAAAWIRYSVESVCFVFANLAVEDKTSEGKENAEKIVQYLQQHDAADRTELHAKLFQGHIKAAELDVALARLLAETPPRVEMIERPRSDGRTGQMRKIYRIKGGGEDSEFSEDS